jgi:methyl-accepting chemotaxis protein
MEREEGEMKEMKLSVKLIGSYLLIAFIAAVIGFIGITRIRTLDKAGKDMYELNTKALGLVGETVVAFLKTRNNLRDIMIDKFILNKDIDSYVATVKELRKEMEKNLPLIENTLKTDEGRKEFASLRENLTKFVPISDKLIELARAGNKEEAMALMRGEAGALARAIDGSVNKMFELNISLAKKKSDDNTSVANVATTLSLVITVMGVFLAVVLGVLLTRSITKPINQVVEGLTDGAEQVASASSQVSSASQSLAEGASEQAAGLEETSSSIEEMSSMSKQNADNANQANTLMTETTQVVNEANRAMVELTASMKEIATASEETAKIIKTIDEIAFQTNLLALNAAVEAARAGEAGAGFAVVADEVRNLAMRASEAAKNTSNLIEGSVKKIKNGSDIVTKTNDAFVKVATGAKKVAELVGEIAAASNEQAQGVDQINKAVAEMDKVVQQNAASAEESASAAEEMNAQAETMKGFVGELAAVVGGSRNGHGNGGRAARSVPHKGNSGKQAMAIDHQPKARAGTRGGFPSLRSKDKSGAREVTALKAREVRPEQVIPMEGGDFGEF